MSNTAYRCCAAIADNRRRRTSPAMDGSTAVAIGEFNIGLGRGIHCGRRVARLKNTMLWVPPRQVKNDSGYGYRANVVATCSVRSRADPIGGGESQSRFARILDWAPRMSRVMALMIRSAVS